MLQKVPPPLNTESSQHLCHYLVHTLQDFQGTPMTLIRLGQARRQMRHLALKLTTLLLNRGQLFLQLCKRSRQRRNLGAGIDEILTALSRLPVQPLRRQYLGLLQSLYLRPER